MRVCLLGFNSSRLQVFELMAHDSDLTNDDSYSDTAVLSLAISENLELHNPSLLLLL